MAVPGMIPPCSLLCQLRICLDLYSPSLVVGEMPMESVELVLSHFQKYGLHLIHREEVTGDIKHETSPFKARGITYAGNRNLSIRNHLPQCGESIYCPRIRTRTYTDLIFPDIQNILTIIQALIG